MLAAPAEPGTAVLPTAAGPAAVLPTAEPAAGTEIDALRHAAVLIGQVRDQTSPLEAAAVYAYGLADLSLRKVTTDALGSFSFAALPAGLYKIIAHKPGFLPAVLLLTRKTADILQELEVELRPEVYDASLEPGDFWKIRERIPPDVLRQITVASSVHDQQLASGASPSTAFATQIQALHGLGGFGTLESAQLSGGLIDVQGYLGSIAVGLEGSFRQLDPTTSSSSSWSDMNAASSNSIALTLDAPSSSRFSFTGHQGRLRNSGGPVDLERFGASWSGALGPGQSALRAEYLEEANFFGDPRMVAQGGSSESQAWQLEGTYLANMSPRSSLQTGIRYEERIGNLALFGVPLALDRQRLELFGVGDYRLDSSVVFQYGLFTSVDHGQMVMAPEAGITVELGPKWSAETSMRRRVKDESLLNYVTDFVPAYYRSAAACTSAEASCYRLAFTRKLNETDSISVGALHREFSDTLRVYFSDDFFDQYDSLVFVRGDEVPELHFSLRSRLAKSIFTHFQSSFAEGGGGRVRAADSSELENAVRYLVTSLDTRFETTDTGVLLAFHRMEQDVAPFTASRQAGSSYNLEMDRLQLLVTQDLHALLGIGADWALKLDMQVSRGTDPIRYTDDELRRRIVGGIAVRF